MLTQRWTVAVVGMALALGAAHAHGAIITWEFAGEVTAVNDSQGTLGGRVQVGDPFSGTYTFDSTMPDDLPEDLRYGVYDSGASGVAAAVGGLTIVTSGTNSGITIGDNYGYVTQKDKLSIVAGLFESDGVRILEFGITVLDETGSVFSSDVLPLAPPSLASFSSRFFSIQGAAVNPPGTGDFSFGGTISSLTPEPSSLALLALAASRMIGRRA